MHHKSTDTLISSLKKILSGEDSCASTKLKLGGLLQYIIYFFNSNNVRNTIITNKILEMNLEKYIHYMGSVSFTQKNDSILLCEPYDYKNLLTYFERKDKKYFQNLDWFDLIQNNKKKILEKPISIFTVCIHYKERSVHYVSFIYIKNREIISFDPGHQIYEEGNDLLKPAVFKAFDSLLPRKKDGNKTIDELGKTCSKFRFIMKDEPSGIQFNGVNRDAFCQTYTIFFLVDFLHRFESHSFCNQTNTCFLNQVKKNKLVDDLCSTLPQNRELKLFQDFIIPIMIKYANKNWLQKILDDYYEGMMYYPNEDEDQDQIYDSRLTKKEFLLLLKNYASLCKVKVCTRINGEKEGKCVINRLKKR